LLSRRLQSLADKYRHEDSVWDIGCDHGLLGLSFLTHPATPAIHLVDPAADAILKLKQKVKDADIPIPQKLSILHRKGQDLKLTTEKKIIYIAGMGGKEIKSILIHLLPQLTHADRIVISPHRAILELRAYLQSSSFRLESEEIIEEDGQFYQILCLNLNVSLQISPFGIEVWKGEVGQRYRQHILEAFEIHKDPLSQALVRYLKSLIS
jgi:tRNA (adenine22-N1)-methyltransferase